MVPSARAQPADLRSRCRRLRGRRRIRRPDHGARAGAPRLVGRGAGGTAHRLECVGPQRPVLCCPASPNPWTRWSGASGSITPRRYGRCRRSGLDYVRSDDPRDRDARRRPIAGWLKVSKIGQCARMISPTVRLYRPGTGRRSRRLADRARARGAQEQALFPCASSAARVSHPSLELRAGPGGGSGSGGRAHLRGTQALSIDPDGRAQARHDARRAACAPNHIVLAGNVHLGSLLPRIAGTLMPIWTYVITTSRSARAWPRRSLTAAR